MAVWSVERKTVSTTAPQKSLTNRPRAYCEKCPVRRLARNVAHAMGRLRLALLRRQGHRYGVSGHYDRKGMLAYVAHGT